MRKIYKTSLAFLFTLFSIAAGAQCTGGTLDALITPTTSWQTITSHSNEYFEFAATAGNVYVFSYCSCDGGSSPNFLPDLTIDSLLGSVSVVGNNVTTNDNSSYDSPCSTKLEWKCNATGTYEVLTNVNNCLSTKNKTATLAYVMVSPSVCYTVSSITYAPDAFNTGTNLNMSVDDGFANSIPIGFSFCYNGVYYNNVVVSSNCYIIFDNGCDSVIDKSGNFSSYTTQTLPFDDKTQTPFTAPSVMFPWIDAYPAIGGNVLYKLYGTAPNRHLTVSFSKVPLYQCNAKLLSTEVQLYETTNIIQIHSKNIPRCAGWTAGGQGVEGLLDSTGFVALVPTGRNHTSWTAASEAWEFDPGCCSVLPVQLVNFSCESEHNGVMLTWETSTEKNNRFFTVERSADGINFSPIAEMPGAGTSSSERNYSYLDTNAWNGANYYRLRETDFDGRSQVFNITSCNEQRMQAGNIFPNPSNGSFTVTLGPSVQSTTITITDVIGRTVYTQQFPPSGTYINQSISLPQLKGVYLLRLDNGQKVIVKKLLLR